MFWEIVLSEFLMVSLLFSSDIWISDSLVRYSFLTMPLHIKLYGTLSFRRKKHTIAIPLELFFQMSKLPPKECDNLRRQPQEGVKAASERGLVQAGAG
jgi:hypothetical protein